MSTGNCIPRLNRRDFLRGAIGTLGVLPTLGRAALLGDAQVLAPRPTHFPPKAKQLLFVFLTGGFSHIDTFDPKPRLRELQGKPIPGEDPIPNLSPATRDATLAELEKVMLDQVNERHAEERGGDLELRARIHSFQTARGMMQEAPDAFNLRSEHPGTLAAYGVTPGDRKSFGWQCLTARRLVERGVRVVELIDTGSGDNWDSHGDMQAHRPKADRVDQALTALIRDLKSRGLFDDTLVVICTEFGRTPWTDASNGKGRNHFAKAFSCLLAGAGVRGGTAFGETDEFGATIVRDPVHVHDYHATILHLMGLDHTRLTYRYAGRDFRLTDVSGEVVKGVLSGS